MIRKYFLGIAIVFVISLIYSRFMVSVGMIGLILLSIVESSKSKEFSFKSFFKDKAHSGLLLVFIAVLLSGLNTTDTQEWLLQIKLKLPFLLLPFAFFVIGPIPAKLHKWIHGVFIAAIALSSVYVGYSYFQDYEAIHEALRKGQSIPTPIDHIHYSIMLAYAVTSCALLGLSTSASSKEKIIFFVLGIYLFVFTHFLAVRSGIVLSYLGVGISILYFIFKQRNFAVGVAGVALLVSIPFIAYKTIPSLNHKVNYMLWDLKQYKKGKGNNYSDSERLMSYHIAMKLIKEAPIFGHGIGDLKPMMKERHISDFGEKQKYIYPHNQYLYIVVSMGFLGAILFFYGLLSPLIHAGGRRNIFLISIFAILLVSFLVENTIQRAVITGFFLFFILLNLNLESENQKESSVA